MEHRPRYPHLGACRQAEGVVLLAKWWNDNQLLEMQSRLNKPFNESKGSIDWVRCAQLYTLCRAAPVTVVATSADTPTCSIVLPAMRWGFPDFSNFQAPKHKVGGKRQCVAWCLLNPAASSPCEYHLSPLLSLHQYNVAFILCHFVIPHRIIVFNLVLSMCFSFCHALNSDIFKELYSL